MSVVIRLKRAGAKKRPFYKIVVADSRRQRDGRFVEMIGWYDPMVKPLSMKIDQDKVKAWIELGAQPSVQVASLLRPMGIVAARASKSPTSATAKASAAKKKAVRRKPRKVTERKVKAKAVRARKKAAGTPPKAKKKSKKS